MSKTYPELTLEEQEKILLVAEGLLREEENWTRSRWKCPIYEDDRRTVQKRDDNGQALYSYCIQGAVNQAAVDVLGHERASEFLSPDHDIDDDFEAEVNSEVMGSGVANALELDEITVELYGKKMGWDPSVFTPEDYNGDLSMAYNDSPHGSREGVVAIFRSRLSQVRKTLGKEA